VLRARRAPIALAATALLLSGCGGPDDTASGEPGATDAPSPTSTSSTDGDTTTEGDEPASGRPIETTYFTARAPRGFDVDVEDPDFSAYASDRSGRTEIDVTMVPTYGNDFTLRQLARQVVRTQTWSRSPRLADETTLGGEPAYHLTGPVGGGRHTETYGVAHQDTHVVVIVESSGSAEDLRTTAQSVLATWQWK
jgi:hypothetical protein